MTTRRKRVLVVDDSALLLDATAQALERAGFAVAIAADFAALERQPSDEPPDLILMDVNMPELYGDDVAAVLRDARGVTAPIYLFSDLDEPELARRAAEAGVDGYLCKRAGSQALVQRVRQILGVP